VAVGRESLLPPVVYESGVHAACIFHEFEGKGTSFVTGDPPYGPT
jgi:hypothetical protein